jgi:hypothetical protein
VALVLLCEGWDFNQEEGAPHVVSQQVEHPEPHTKPELPGPAIVNVVFGGTAVSSLALGNLTL